FARPSRPAPAEDSRPLSPSVLPPDRHRPFSTVLVDSTMTRVVQQPYPSQPIKGEEVMTGNSKRRRFSRPHQIMPLNERSPPPPPGSTTAGRFAPQHPPSPTRPRMPSPPQTLMGSSPLPSKDATASLIA